jgi:hypothetical protein
MERLWNIVHYFIYRADYKLHLLFNRINPFVLLFKLPHSKRNFEKSGVDPMDAFNKAFKRPDFGISKISAGGFINMLFFLLCLGLINCISGITQMRLNMKLYHFMLLVLISLVVNHFLLFKKKKYRTYFKEFEKMPEGERKKWALISFLVVIGILLFFIGSFVFMIYRF